MYDQVITPQINGIIRDADVLPDGKWACVFEYHGTYSLMFGDNVIRLERPYSCPHVRILNQWQVFVVDTIAASEADKNGTIFSFGSSHRQTSFHAGHGISLVLTTSRYLVCTYFDQGVMSGNSYSRDGVIVFNHRGEYRQGAPDINVKMMDCYAACNMTEDKIAFYSYPGFPLVEWDLKMKTHTIIDSPDEVIGAHSMAYRDGVYYFHGPYRRNDELYAFADGRCDLIGEFHGWLKPIHGGRFVSFGNRTIDVHIPTR